MAAQVISTPPASYEVWHSRLGHAAFDTISLLQKHGSLYVTSLLPKPVLCSTCQLAKQHRLPFAINKKRALHVLDLVHCDLWGPSPITSTDGYQYYVLFIDDFSRFTWFYPLKRKSDFFDILKVFLAFVQTQFGTKLKVFQSDGGTEFVNARVKNPFLENGTLISYLVHIHPSKMVERNVNIVT
ncbi:putative RNA-directed DNA polymerase [Helianthus annuus]|nr:putative RNA-directed DNA polymerase [Helianthus annuus]